VSWEGIRIAPTLASWWHIASVDADLCAGCETCAARYSQEAIELMREPARGS